AGADPAQSVPDGEGGTEQCRAAFQGERGAVADDGWWRAAEDGDRGQQERVWRWRERRRRRGGWIEEHAAPHGGTGRKIPHRERARRRDADVFGMSLARLERLRKFCV